MASQGSGAQAQGTGASAARGQAEPARTGVAGSPQGQAGAGAGESPLVASQRGQQHPGRLSLWTRFQQWRTRRLRSRLCRQALRRLQRNQQMAHCLLSPIFLPSGPLANPSATPKRDGLAGMVGRVAVRLNRLAPSRRPGDRLWLAYHRQRRRLTRSLLPRLIPPLYVWCVKRFFRASKPPGRT